MLRSACLGLNLHACVSCLTLPHFHNACTPCCSLCPPSLCPQPRDAVVFWCTRPPVLVLSPSRAMLRWSSELWQHFNCSITCAAGHITAERLQLAASCSRLPRHGRRSVAQSSLGVLGMLGAQPCSPPRYWKTCFAAWFARKSGTRKRTSGECVDCSQFSWGKHD